MRCEFTHQIWPPIARSILSQNKPTGGTNKSLTSPKPNQTLQKNMIWETKIQVELLGSLRGVPYLRKMERTAICPEWHYHSDDLGGVCTPIKKTFKQWVEETKIGEYIPVPSSKSITHAEFVETVNSVLKDVGLLNEIKEVYCEQEVLLEKAEDWKKRYMETMASYFR